MTTSILSLTYTYYYIINTLPQQASRLNASIPAYEAHPIGGRRDPSGDFVQLHTAAPSFTKRPLQPSHTHSVLPSSPTARSRPTLLRLGSFFLSRSLIARYEDPVKSLYVVLSSDSDASNAENRSVM